jgi:ubiquinone/menaquinone biosynthesis C-methylase UbiE
VTLSTTEQQQENSRRRRAWDKQATRYDKQIGFWERCLLGQDNRAWACQRAQGNVLDLAVGTGLNIPLYDIDLDLTGIELSPAMLDIARTRAADLNRTIDLREGDAHNLPFEDDSFDTVVCTYSLCNIPDPRQAVTEMRRVLHPQGRLVLVDHIRSSVRPIYWLQKLLEVATVRIDGDRITRRRADIVEQLGFKIIERDRFRWGIVERLVAVKPG